MEAILEEPCEVPVVEEADVAVIGGGTAGFTAALSAARNGARTVLIERWGYVGGAAVGGMVITIPESAGVWGIEREFHERLAERDGIASSGSAAGDPWVNLSPVDCKILGDEMLQEAGVVLLYHSLFVAAVTDGNRVEAVIIENKSGRQAVRARVCVDATGDGDVAARAGVPFTLGDGNAGFEPTTTMYMAAAVDIETLLAKKPPPEDVPGRVSGIAATIVHPGELNCWGGSVQGDGTDVRDLTRMEIELRAQIREEFANMKRCWPGMERAYISCLAEQMGVRETRHVHADYMISVKDRKAKRRFDDSIGRCWEFTVPYRSLCALGVDNLLVAGRCLGGELPVARILRIVPNCCTTGQAAGAAAALAARDGGAVRGIDVAALQTTLEAQGVELNA